MSKLIVLIAWLIACLYGLWSVHMKLIAARENESVGGWFGIAGVFVLALVITLLAVPEESESIDE